MTADEEDNYQEHVWLEEQGYVPKMVEIGEAVRTLNAARRFISPEILRFASGQGRRVCPMVWDNLISAPFLNKDWIQVILDAGDMLNAAIKANPTLTAEWSDDWTELKVSFA